MIFTSFTYLFFFASIFTAYWLVRNKFCQNLLLLIGSYVFYGFIHPWFCVLIATSTVVDYFCGLGMARFPQRRKLMLILSVTCNLSMLGFFKYFNFFAENVQEVALSFGLNMSAATLSIVLPVGISFYTFQTLSYTIDIYRKKLKPRKNFLDFALFVAFFPQLVAGPIERAYRFLPQIETPRKWNWDMFLSAWPLLIRGYLKKLFIADNIAIYVDKIFTLEHPTLLLLLAGSLAFAVQIYADFSAYTDIARASARLLGFDLMKNFKSPYLAITPSDFWGRWHISFSSWIRDYLYIPLGGSRVPTKRQFACVLFVSLGLSGLWHGAAWNFVSWGIYHAILLYIYHRLSLTGSWVPKTKSTKFIAWAVMFTLTIFGWTIFRASSTGWLAYALTFGFDLGLTGDSLAVSLVVLLSVAFYTMPLFVLLFLDRVIPNRRFAHALVYGLAIVVITIFFRETGRDFIYFQF